MICKQCTRDFPDDLIAPLTVSSGEGDVIELKMCPLCAYEFINIEHGLPAKTPPRAPMALAMFRRAQAHVGEPG